MKLFRDLLTYPEVETVQKYHAIIRQEIREHKEVVICQCANHENISMSGLSITR